MSNLANINEQKARIYVIVDSQVWPDSALYLVLVNIANDFSHEDNYTV